MLSLQVSIREERRRRSQRCFVFRLFFLGLTCQQERMLLRLLLGHGSGSGSGCEEIDEGGAEGGECGGVEETGGGADGGPECADDDAGDEVPDTVHCGEDAEA